MQYVIRGFDIAGRHVNKFLKAFPDLSRFLSVENVRSTVDEISVVLLLHGTPEDLLYFLDQYLTGLRQQIDRYGSLNTIKHLVETFVKHVTEENQLKIYCLIPHSVSRKAPTQYPRWIANRDG